MYTGVTYALTGTFLSAAATHTPLNISTLSSILQLMFFLRTHTLYRQQKQCNHASSVCVCVCECVRITYFEKVSEAAPNMATSSAPASIYI